MYRLIKVANEFSQEFDIVFNPEKFQLVALDKHGPMNETLQLNDIRIASEASAVHLGSLVGHNVCNHRIKSALKDMITHANTLSSIFSHVHYDVKYKLFKSYGMSYYGSQLWDLSCKCINELYTTWRKCIRRLFAVPPTTHCKLLHLICNDVPVEAQLYKRFIKFFLKALDSNNECIRVCAISALNGSGSVTSNNTNFIAQWLNVNKYHMCKLCVCKCVNCIYQKVDRSNEDEVVAGQIRDLLSLKRQCHHHQDFTYNDFDIMTTYLCCN